MIQKVVARTMAVATMAAGGFAILMLIDKGLGEDKPAGIQRCTSTGFRMSNIVPYRREEVYLRCGDRTVVVQTMCSNFPKPRGSSCLPKDRFSSIQFGETAECKQYIPTSVTGFLKDPPIFPECR
jgi:hypothetical protein